MKLLINKNKNPFTEDVDFELVERKGVGHPDTICDAIAERASRNYSQYCIEKFGNPAHHWFDKVMLIGGEANVEFGRGEITKPYLLIFAGKVCYYIGKEYIPVENILFNSACEVLSAVLTGFEKDKHVIIENKLVDYQGAGRKDSRYRPNSKVDLPSLHSENLVSNDSNLLSGYAPMTTLESLVLEAERYINSPNFKKDNPDTGWDVKLFGSRRNDEYELLINMPFLAKHINTLDQYFQRKQEVYDILYSFLTDKFKIKINLTMNATDRNGRAYLTALGSVADTGDVGVVGRGNRINGLITPMRPMSIEAPAGKNPIDHTGKLYGILANELAWEIHNVINLPVEVHIFTAKETKLNNPDEITVKIYSNDNIDDKMEIKIKEIVNDKIENIGNLSEKIIFEGVIMW